MKLITDKGAEITIPEGAEVEIHHHVHTETIDECLPALRTYQRQGLAFTANGRNGTRWWQARYYGVEVTIFLPDDITDAEAQALIQQDTPATTPTTEEDR